MGDLKTHQKRERGERVKQKTKNNVLMDDSISAYVMGGKAGRVGLGLAVGFGAN